MSKIYEACGTPASLPCLESSISRDLSKAKTCSRVKALQKRANYLVPLAVKGNVSWSVPQAKQVKSKLTRKACAKQASMCPTLTESCRR